MSVKERVQEISKHVSVAFANYVKEVDMNEKR